MWVYLYQNNSELAMKNAYIGEYQEWYKFLRWTITANRDNVSIVQMSEFEICDNNWTKMPRPSWTTITANHPWNNNEGIDKIIDGSTSTKYCTNNSVPIIVTISLWAEIDLSVYNKYKRYTANDASGRDPKSWTIEMSRNWSNWDTVSTVTDANITTTRYALAWTWDITVN